jgi:hypothetical protein
MRLCSLAVTGGLLVNCAANVDSEYASSTQEIGVECANAQPTASYCHGLNVTSPFTYSTTSCFKGVVYDVVNYDGNLGASSAALETRVRWGSPAPSLADCTKAVVFSDLFYIWGGASYHAGAKSAYGKVVAGACVVPSLSWGSSEMYRGGNWRIAASARRDSASIAPTRVVVVETLANGSANQCLTQAVGDGEACTVEECNPASGVVTRTTSAQGTICFPGAGGMYGVCTEAGKCSIQSGPGSECY